MSAPTEQVNLHRSQVKHEIDQNVTYKQLHNATEK